MNITLIIILIIAVIILIEILRHHFLKKTFRTILFTIILLTIIIITANYLLKDTKFEIKNKLTETGAAVFDIIKDQDIFEKKPDIQKNITRIIKIS